MFSSTMLGRRAYHTLTKGSIAPSILNAEYAVRGAVVIKAGAIEKELKSDPSKFPFSKMVPCNIGNPQAVGQDPLTFPRQVLSCITNKELIGKAPYPDDVFARAEKYNSAVGRIGAYSHSAGHEVFRKDIADFVTARDGILASPDDYYCTDGASVGVKTILSLLCRSKDDGVLIPIPQYPLYSATITLCGGTSVGYYLDESKGWAIDMAELEKSVADFKKKGGTPRALCVINPGNPTGAVATRETLEALVKLCEKEKLVLLGDEVYQSNIYGSDPFISLRKVVKEMKANVELFSFHSVSKGFTGECGLRGGYLELTNIHEDAAEQIYKLMSICLCSNTLGQAVMALKVSPPKEGEPSYAQWKKEYFSIKEAMIRKAKMTEKALNADGISCAPVSGAMYAFPSIEMPKGAYKAAEAKGMAPDAMWCMDLVDKTGVITVPGSGFGQRDGTWHFRTTILPDEATLTNVLGEITSFQKDFMSKYA